MMTKAQHYLQLMGIDVWVSRASMDVSDAALSFSVQENKKDAWSQLQQQVAQCTACGLCQTRTQTVFGSGNSQAKLMFIGEAPGAEEDRQGKPFVGRAGQLLTNMLQAIGLTRDQVFIANILKCRPPNNRDPLPQEVQQCTPFLKQQIQSIQPRLLVALGRISAHFLLNTSTSLTQLRGKTFKWGEHNVPLIVTYHPAYLLRSPHDKAKAYQDLLRIQQMLSQLN